MAIPYNPYDYIDGTNPNIRKGRFEYLTSSLKKMIQDSIDEKAGSPFIVILGGERSYQNNDNTLKLVDRDWSGTSGYVQLKMKSGFQSLFFVATENNDFFDDYALDGIRSGWTNENDLADDLEGQWPTVWYQADTDGGLSRTMFGLDEGDHISIDIDGESSRVAQMRVRLSGVDYFSNVDINDETYLSKLWVRKWNANYERNDPTLPTITDPNPNPDYDPITCPLGEIDNGSGVCIPDPNYVPIEPGPEPTKEDDVSAVAMVALVAGIALVIVVALKVRA